MLSLFISSKNKYAFPSHSAVFLNLCDRLKWFTPASVWERLTLEQLLIFPHQRLQMRNKALFAFKPKLACLFFVFFCAIKEIFCLDRNNTDIFMTFQGRRSIWNRIITVHLNERQQFPVFLRQICTRGATRLMSPWKNISFFPVRAWVCVCVYRCVCRWAG